MKKNANERSDFIDKKLIKNTLLRLKLISFLIFSKRPSTSIRLHRCIEEIEKELEKLI